MPNIKKNINKDNLSKQIKAGKSSNDAARSLGVSQSTIMRKAKEYGLNFNAKSIWRVL
jgi:transcriptional regulator of acetoin/glycerol metabolism|tara:strand:+ start:98 stop:271 length:174 start_codon:yes stop_codon:yes gene_type:complete